MQRSIIRRSMLLGVMAIILWFNAPVSAQHVVVVLDDSSSMSEPLRSDPRITKIEAAKQALLTILRRIPEDSQVGVLVLNGPTNPSEWVIPLGPINEERLTATITQIRPGGGTPLGAGMKLATDALLALRNQEHYGDYRLLIVTDGEASDPNLVETYLPDILNRSITVDVIGVDMQQYHSLATRVDNYRKADDSVSLQRAIQASLAESNVDDQNADETSDFELLEAWPDELALTAIQTLSVVNNDPIERSAEVQPHSHHPFTPVNNRNTNWMLIFFVLVAILAVASVLRSKFTAG